MNTQALMQSLVLTGVGMSVVFAFMGLMILFVHGFIAIALRFFPSPPEDTGTPEGAPANLKVSGNGDKKAAAAAAAVETYLGGGGR